MKKALLFTALFFLSLAVFAEEVFETTVLSKEMRSDFGNGTLSVADNVYTIEVMHNDAPMKIEVNEAAYNLIHIGDQLRLTVELNGSVYEVQAIKLIRRQS